MMTNAQIQEQRDLVAQAMHCAEVGNATHWPTVASILRDEILRLRSDVEWEKGHQAPQPAPNYGTDSYFWH